MRAGAARLPLPAFAGVALVAFALVAVLLARVGLTAPIAHVLLAVGLMPLMLAAILYFVPVLTRRHPATGAIRYAPWTALLAGLLAVAGLWRWPALIYAAASLALMVVVAVLAWTAREARRSLGPPHPGLAWYVAALCCLAAALVAVLATGWRPDAWMPLRRFHLHLNLLGFVGLTAIGTLQVLLPTAGGYEDKEVGGRLRTDLKYALGGAVAIALGSAALAPLVWLGLLAWLVPLARFARTLFLRGEWPRGAAASLAVALAGFLLALLAGALHAPGLVPPSPSLAFFLVGFLFPLVTGALTHLLPLWLAPSAPTAEIAPMRAELARGAGLRALLFLLAGLLLLAGWREAALLAAGVLFVFAVQVARAIRRAT